MCAAVLASVELVEGPILFSRAKLTKKRRSIDIRLVESANRVSCQREWDACGVGDFRMELDSEKIHTASVLERAVDTRAVLNQGRWIVGVHVEDREVLQPDVWD